MTRNIISLITGLVLLFPLQAQTVNHNSQNANFTLEDAILNGYQFYGSSLRGLQWTFNEGEYSYSEKGSLVIEDLKGKSDTINLNMINSSLPEGEKIKRFPSGLEWVSENSFRFSSASTLYTYNNADKQTKTHFSWAKEAGNTDIAPDGQHIAYTIDNNLYIAGAEGETTVTSNSKDSYIVNGQSVHRNEFGITKGTFWSPTGNILAWYRKDESMVKDYPLVDITAREAEVEMIKYPMAGMTSHEVKLMLFDLENEKSIEVRTKGPADQYLTNVAWGPAGKYIYIAVLQRDLRKMDLNQYSVTTGEFVKTLFTEEDKKYVEPLHAMEFIPGRDNEFLWRSQRDGYDHFYRYNTNGRLLNQVSIGEWLVSELIGFDGNYVYFSATDNLGLDKVVYRSSIKNSKSTKLSNISGVHSASLSAGKAYIIDRWSNLDTPTQITAISAKTGKKVKELYSQDIPEAAKALGKIELGRIKAADGVTELNTRLIYPADFDPGVKYPVLIYTYNGPHAQMINNSWLARTSMWMPYFANKGYLVFTVDGRGSFNRGKEFEQVIFRNLGENEMADQVKGVEYLKSLSFVDGDRIAVHGWSYGGFMTTGLMTTYPKLFTTGVAGGPVIDWKWYEIMYGERYMDTPQTNPEGYKKTSLLNKAKNLEGKLLLIHGYVDPTVVPQHSLAFIEQCIKDGVQVDYFLYPRHEHNVRGRDRIHLMEKVLDYIEENNR